MATAFQNKPLTGAKTLGERLRAVREEIGVNLERVARDTGIQLAYLQALETSSYGQLPSVVYARNFVKRYAEYLQLNPLSVLQLFDKERLLLERSGRSGAQPASTRPRFSSLHFITPKLIRRVFIGLVFLVCFIYLGFVVYKSMAPPNLSVTEPADNIITQERSLAVSGQVEPGAKVSINGQLVMTSQDGKFREVVNLQEGINIIEIVATKNRGKPTVIYRQVLVKNI